MENLEAFKVEQANALASSDDLQNRVVEMRELIDEMAQRSRSRWWAEHGDEGAITDNLGTYLHRSEF